jgi:dolichyl-phosphate-mannose-protein mannosyltransferase
VSTASSVSTSPQLARPKRVPLGRDASGARLDLLADRLLTPLPARSPLWWLVYLAITAVGGLLRFVDLSNPHSFVFDETYYPKDAWSLLHFGTEQAYTSNANTQILAGHTLDQWTHPSLSTPSCLPAKGVTWCPEYVVHPPIGKWMIALGEAAFGMNPFGWRFVVALCGTLAVLLVGRLARRLTRSDLLGALAALLYAVDGMAIVEARTAILDSLLAFWLILALCCLLIDRDRSRAILLDRVAGRTEPFPVQALGPKVGFRKWRWAAGLCFGLGCGTKWNAVFLLAVMGVLTWLWDASARRAIGVPRWLSASFLRDAPGAFISLVGTSAVLYVASWTGWFVTRDGYNRQWATNHPPGTLTRILPSAFRSWLNYQQQMYQFNTTLDVGHPYASNPISWLVLYKPVAFAYTGGLSTTGAAVSGGPDVRAVHALGTPLLWWGACIALLVCVWMWAGTRDWRAGFVLAGVLGTWIPWFHYAHRTIFSFYAIVTLPFLVLSLVLVIGRLLGPGGTASNRRLWATAGCGVFVALIVVNSAYLYPILTNELIPYTAWHQRMWFSSWI